MTDRVLLDTAVPTIFVRTVTLKQQQAPHKSNASAGAPSSSTAVSSVDVATVTDIDGSTLLVPTQTDTQRDTVAGLYSRRFRLVLMATAI